MEIVEPVPKENTNGTRLVSYASVNVAFDEESPVVKYARRSSLQPSIKSVSSLKKFPVVIEENNGPPPQVDPNNGCKMPMNNFRTSQREVIVKVQNAYKRYGRSGPFVLKNLSMNVERGTIYSLLGSSGCGKTTALTSILGMRHLDKGSISVFGKSPGSPGSGVPGNRVGYMPQEIALYADFSIDETLTYYGTLLGMSSTEIKSGRDYLMSFLDFHDESRRIKELSSGQQRRVSLAVALIHSPEIIVLDEPTVGTDALLREKIWEHLVWLVKEHGSTIIITTHYTEEARHSNMIGLMRGGYLLAENDPATLLAQHNASFLEDIVLKLCRNDEFPEENQNYNQTTTTQAITYPAGQNSAEQSTQKDRDTEDSLSHCSSISGEEDEENKKQEKEEQNVANSRRRVSVYVKPGLVAEISEKRPNSVRRSINRIRGLILKNIFVMLRNIFLVLFMIITPSFMVLLICNGIGNDPKPLNLGVVNMESNFSNCVQYSQWRTDHIGAGEEEGCDLDYLSCKFLNRIPKDIVQIEYGTIEEAVEAVKIGNVWGYIALPENYSDNVYTRTSSGNRVDEDALDGSFITYQMDMTSKTVTGFLKKTLFDSYEEFIKLMLTNCGLNEKLGDRPLKSLDPIYGSDDTDLGEYIAPSLLVGFLFFFPLCSSSVQFIYDKKLGTLERARVAGVHTSEIMLSYFVTDGFILMIQLALSLSIITLLFGFQVRGSLILLIIQYFLMGLGGVSCGFLFASICTEEVQAVLLAMAAFFPNFLLSGLLWPIAGMPPAMQAAAYVLPCTFPGEAIRSILSRGWGFTSIHVWPGFAAAVLWLMVYWLMTLLVHKIALRRK